RGDREAGRPPYRARRAVHGARSSRGQGLPAIEARRTACRTRRARAPLLHRHAGRRPFAERVAPGAPPVMARPPVAAVKVADWPLARTLRSHAEHDMVVGDLREELPRRGRLWYIRQAIAIAAHALLRPSSTPADPRRSGDVLMRTLGKDVKYAWRSL